MNKKGMKTWLIVLIFVGAFLILGILLIGANIFVNMKVASFMDNPEDTKINSCMSIRLRITDIDSEADNITIERMAGGEDAGFVEVKFLVNGEDAEFISDYKGLNQLETKTYHLNHDIHPGDTIEVASIIIDYDEASVCEVNDKKTA
jgi:uncharacterized protein YneF (UPF0154 family)